MQTKKRKEQSHSTKIDINILYDLFAKTSKNVNSLKEESKLLLDNKFYARSYVLSIAALEEMGKRMLVADYINGMVSDKEFNEIFRSHELKLSYLRNNINIIKDEYGNLDFEIVYDKSKHKKWINLRHQSLYVGLENNEITSPLDIVDEKYAEYIYNYLKEMIRKITFSEEMNGLIGSKAIYK